MIWTPRGKSADAALVLVVFAVLLVAWPLGFLFLMTGNLHPVDAIIMTCGFSGVPIAVSLNTLWHSTVDEQILTVTAGAVFWLVSSALILFTDWGKVHWGLHAAFLLLWHLVAFRFAS
ncbi:MAG: hypothetical protein ACI8QS_000952 [Planctomycetota bacterium]|jgi:hypothetical protein